MTALMKALLGEFDYEPMRSVDPLMAALLFASYMILVWMLLFNMLLALIISTFDKVQEELKKRARTEVTGLSLLLQNGRSLMKLLLARSLDDLTKVAPETDSLHHGYRQGDMAIFDQEFLTSPDFRALFEKDSAALKRMGVRSVEELVRSADATGNPRLDMSEVHEYIDKVRAVAGKLHKDEAKHAFLAPSQLDQIKRTMENTVQVALETNTDLLQRYIHNQLAQATLVLSGNSMPLPTNLQQGGGGAALGGCAR